MSAFLDSLRPELIWGLFTRGLGLIFLISFASLVGQVAKGAGMKSGLPIALRLERIRRDFPTWRRFVYFPTLLWLGASDAMLRAYAASGVAAALLVIHGGASSFWALFACYALYLTLDMAIGLIFPWDSLLFEASVLGLFLPPTHALPVLDAVSAPAPALAWAYRLLLFRVMFGFGKQKFIGSTSKDLAYLKGFLISQPLPSPLGWYVQKLPTVLLKPLVVFMFFVEIPAPIFGLIPGPLSIVCAVSTILLMIGIQAMGSFGYFSMLTMVGCVPLFDNVTPTHLHVTEMFSAGAPVLTNAFVLVHTMSSMVAFLFNSWVAQSWHLWSFWYRLPRVLQLPFDFLRAMHPFRWLHSYGVFPPNTSPDVKITLLVEVSWDEREWHELRLPISPTHPESPPLFVSPYHPRGDQAVIYETFGLNPTSLVSSMAGPWDPYCYGARSGADLMLQRILEGKGLEFVKSPELERRAEPPLAARISTVMLEPVGIKEHLATGKWWKRTYVGPHAPPRRLDPEFWTDFLPEPEMWHFDSIYWRRRTRVKELMDRSLAGRDDPMALALLNGGDLTERDEERFWNELVPLLGTDRTFEVLPDVVASVRERFNRRDLRAMHRLLGRFSLLLVARLEPLYLNRGFKPEVPAQTYFHLWMATQQIIGKGRDAFLAAMADPKGAVTRELPEMTTESGLFFLSLFRYEMMIFDAQKLRLITAISPPHDEAAKHAAAYSLDQLNPSQRKLAELAQSISGYVCVMPYIRDGFKGPRFDRGYPELYPSFQQLDSGAIALRAYGTAPEGVSVPVNAGPVAAE